MGRRSSSLPLWVLPAHGEPMPLLPRPGLSTPFAHPYELYEHLKPGERSIELTSQVPRAGSMFDDFHGVQYVDCARIQRLTVIQLYRSSRNSKGYSDEAYTPPTATLGVFRLVECPPEHWYG
ncbi:hypothetical protein Hypma_016182 [Hypsizygus marmoreus]|uniref:Uncharacterized protein n=1 Tax=Hypsizygus marmoreus TaxID=39966 RepID=A0A369J650_HYPMA|nr:hypothetical protein Hypma_016182 [Hypsizygus marmoreus]